MPTKIPSNLKNITTNNQQRFTTNDNSLMRSQFLNKLLDPRRDIDDECGYPKDISAQQYRYLYDREGIAERVVSMMPTECWSQDPMIRENEDADQTEFENVFEALQKEMNIFHFLGRADEMSGIGSYGVLLLGINDGKSLEEPVDAVSATGEKVGNAQHELLYMRVFDESLVDVSEFEDDETNPRFGQPVMYDVTFADPRNEETTATKHQDGTNRTVHWSRLIHLADNRKSSEIFGVPRMRPVYNRLYDLRKLLGGSAEMFWKGAFPGMSFEVNPDMGDVELDAATLRTEFENYSNGLQRYLALAGVQAKSLSPQVANPEAHINAQIKAIAITLGVPWRIFVGSEQAQLASSQDKQTWNNRVAHRQSKYVAPMVIRPFIDRLIAFGILPEVEEFVVEFPDLASPTDDDKATVGGKQIEAISKYVGAGIDTLLPPKEFFTIIMGFDAEQADAIIESANEQMDEMEIDEDDLELEFDEPEIESEIEPDDIIEEQEPVEESETE
tara:strand:+ start:2780 stop:4282 length:1503 start_codon:yes stop_codon:yes gene_type:complete